MNKKKIGKRIAENRKKKQLTQQELANKLDVTNRTIINWENGKYFPDYALLLPLCEALDVSINELLTGEEDKEPKANATTELILNYLDRNRIFVKFHNRIPRYYVDKISNGKSVGILYLETPFYDAYECYDQKPSRQFTIVPASIKNYSNKDTDYLIDKYCSHLNYEAGDN